uniref:protein transport protein Sec24C-like n=1 Tax=Styela clava TaxID=7725 RepID=UPI001939EF6B|nr:protein transport protein Sec24C-like [Styela clava]
MNGYDGKMYNGSQQYGSARMMPPVSAGVPPYSGVHGQPMMNPPGRPGPDGNMMMNSQNVYNAKSQFPQQPPIENQMRNVQLNDHNAPMPTSTQNSHHPPSSYGNAPPMSGPSGTTYNHTSQYQPQPQYGAPPIQPNRNPPTSYVQGPPSGPHAPNYSQPPTMNRAPGPGMIPPPSSGMGGIAPRMGQPPVSSMGPPGPGMGPPGPGMGQPPVSSMGPPGPGMGQPPVSRMGPPGPNMGQPPAPGMGHLGPGMLPPTSNQKMGQPLGPGMAQPPGIMGQPPGPQMVQPPGMMGGSGPQMDGRMQPPGSGQYGSQAPQPRRLDPDAMPSPIQVLSADQAKSTEPFRTDNPGLVPPLVTSKFVAEDCGSASPRYIRCATYNLPATSDIAKTCQVPMALSIKAMAKLPQGEAPALIVNPGPEGPIRCKRCKAYMCPQFKFHDGGRRFQCVMCSAVTDTPHHFFDHVDHMNQRVDKYQRPELCRGSYEFITTKDYCRNDEFPNPPAYIFAIDVSYNAIKCGLVELLCNRIKDLLDNLPCDVGAEETSIRVAFFTYNNSLHFYNLKSTLAQPQMLVVSDVSDVFVPLQDGFLVSVKESRHVINSLLDQIPEMFADTRDTEVVLAPVIQAAVQALKSAKCPGKLFLFLTSLPTAEAPGKLKTRDDRKLIGTDKAKVLFAPAGNVYSNLAKECVAQACCVDLFLFPNQYIDIATIGQVAQATGGDIFKYNFFRPEVDGERFIKNLAYDIERDIVFDAILRVRTSAGIRAVNFVGALSMSNTTDVELAGLDCDKAICVEIKHDDKISEDLGAFVQVAVLFTSVGGQRRLRVHNLHLAVCNQIGDLYRSCEADVLINYIAKTAIKAGLTDQESKIREELVTRVANILAAYRKHCATPSSAGQLILPECMKLLPVYLNSVLKNDAIHSSHEISTDDKAYLRQLITGMDVAESQVYFYPRLFPVRQFTPPNLPTPVRCSEERLDDSEAYLLDNGLSFFLWIGNAIDPEWVRSVFGVQSTAQIDIDLGNLHPFDNPSSQQLRDLMDLIQSGRTRRMKLAIIRQRDKLEPWFKHFLVEDRGMGGGASYVDFLCHIHKEIRSILA